MPAVARLESIQKSLKERDANAESNALLSNLIDVVRKWKDERNALAHGWICISDDFGVALASVSNGRVIEPEELPNCVLRAEYVSDLAWAVMNCLKGEEFKIPPMPPDPKFWEGKNQAS